MDTQINVIHGTPRTIRTEVNSFLKEIGKSRVIKVCDLVADIGNPGYFACMVIYHGDDND